MHLVYTVGDKDGTATDQIVTKVNLRQTRAVLHALPCKTWMTQTSGPVRALLSIVAHRISRSFSLCFTIVWCVSYLSFSFFCNISPHSYTQFHNIYRVCSLLYTRDRSPEVVCLVKSRSLSEMSMSCPRYASATWSASATVLRLRRFRPPLHCCDCCCRIS